MEGLNFKKLNKNIRYALLIAVAFCASFCAIAKDLDLFPPNFGLSFGYSDSGLHFLGAGGIGFLFFIFSRKDVSIKGYIIPALVLLYLVLSILEETSQIIRPNRGFSFVDMAANVLGIIAFSFFAKLLVRLKLIIR